MFFYWGRGREGTPLNTNTGASTPERPVRRCRRTLFGVSVDGAVGAALRKDRLLRAACEVGVTSLMD
jgi:hypothetical protein